MHRLLITARFEKVPVKTEVHPYPLEKANEALDDLRAGRFNGAAVIVVDEKATR